MASIIWKYSIDPTLIYNSTASNTNNGTVIIVGNNNILRSTDYGVTWSVLSESSYPENTNLNAVYYANNTWISVGGTKSDYLIIKSTDDGKTWEQVKTPKINKVGSLYSIMYGNGVWISTGLSSPGQTVYNVVFKSIDNGESWTDISIDPTVNFFNSVAYNGTTWGMVGLDNNGSILYTSTDNGLTWRKIAAMSIANRQFHDITYSGGNWIILAAYNTVVDGTIYESAAIYMSVDINTFPTPTEIVGNTLRSVSYNGEKWIAVGQDVAALAVILQYTGGDWTQNVSLIVNPMFPQFTANGILNTSLNNITYTGKHFVVTGIERYSNSGIIYTSTASNGNIWTESSINKNIVQFIAAGNNNSTWIVSGITKYNLGVILRSVDNGQTWKDITSKNNIYQINSIAYGLDVWIAVGQNITNAESIILKSIDNGETWVSVSTPIKQSMLYGVATNNANTWITFGTIATQEGSVILKSNDNGDTWTQDNYTSFRDINNITYGNNVWIMTSTTIDPSGGIYDYNIISSNDNGLTWNKKAVLTQIKSVVYKNNVWVGVGDGILVSSDNGLTWEQKKSNVSLDSVSYSSGVFIALSSGDVDDINTFVSSDNGETWTEILIPKSKIGIFTVNESSGGQNFLIYGNGILCSVLSAQVVGYIRYSNRR
jgi:photosystem II stability/assembly factor-like uncharacterized protein